jgi:hypothetical protein
MIPKKKEWTPFVRANTLVNPKIPVDKLKEWIKQGIISDEIYVNSRYQVSVHRSFPTRGEGPELIHLSIKTIEKTADHDWRDFQRIKNELIGPEQEAFELYPAESRLVDTSNQFHIWCFKDMGMPVGFTERLVSESGDPIGAVQRPFDKDNRPPDLTYVTTEMMDKLAQEDNK